tara:strand:+ start:60332 stop:60466 length:135 start_codon:yes stop_codon:yes gene_type:complete
MGKSVNQINQRVSGGRVEQNQKDGGAASRQALHGGSRFEAADQV